MSKTGSGSVSKPVSLALPEWAKRYEVSPRQWERLKDLLPGKAGDRGRTAVDNRQFVNGVLWVLRRGVRWGDLPERYGNWKSVHKRFTRGARAGVWEQMVACLTADRQNDYLMRDSTITRAHQQAATGKGGTGPDSGAVPRGIDHQDSSGYGWPRTTRPLYCDRWAAAR